MVVVENRKNITIHEKTTKVGFRNIGTGKLYLRFDDENYKSIVHHAKKGVFNYDAIVSDFVAMLDRISAKITREAAEKALGQRCKAFEVENGLFRHNITLDPHNLMVTIRCRDESEMKRFSLALKQASEAGEWKAS
jgi:hypothetical protein